MQPSRKAPWRAFALALTLATATAVQAQTAQRITSPKEEFGFDIGDDYQLVNYTRMESYWKKLDAESDRMVLKEMGKTAEGRTQWVAIISAPENIANLEHYREISQKLAQAKGLSDDEARKLAEEGKAVVWIDGGLHASEVLGSQQLIKTVYELVSRNDPETLRILKDVIVLAVPANPDGQDLVADWYNREPVPEKRSTAGVPRLWQKYVGHDDNRDFYLVAQNETKNMNRLMYREWFPQIVFNHHQTGPVGTVIFSPPFRDPFNFNIDPMVIEGIDMVGAALHQRYLQEDLPGFTLRGGAPYSTWWNGGLRTEAYFHNMIGILTEAIGNPTPIDIPFVPERQLPSGDLPYPIAPQSVWHFSQSMKYELASNYAILDLAQRYKSTFLHNIYLMGQHSIENGSEDHWTASPKRIEAAEAALGLKAAPGDDVDYFGRNPETAPAEKFAETLRKPEDRDPRGYVIPADQPDFATATKFVNSLLYNGVEVMRATKDFDVAGKHYPAGSYVVKTAQAFRPQVMDMFEPQNHPNDIPYPGAPPKPPYDVAGWTLAMQMGVHYDRVMDGFDGPFEAIEGVDIKAPAGKIVASAKKAKGYYFSHEMNDAFVAVNRLLKADKAVYWLKQPQQVEGRTWPAGTFYAPAGGGVLPILEKTAADKGVSFYATSDKPQGDAVKLRPARIGLWDRYGGSMPSGWTRWLFEQYEFPYQLVFPKELDAGNLNKKYDVLVFVTDAIPEKDGGRRRYREDASKLDIPDSLQYKVGDVTVATTVPQLKDFMEKGGTVITEGSSTVLASLIGLPVEDALVAPGKDGQERHLPSTKFYIPGSILSARVDTAAPLTAGITDPVNVFFDHSPAFKLGADAAAKGVKPLVWFDTDAPLKSGWAWGQQYLKGAVEAAEASVGKGDLYLFAPEITFRAQPAGTFKFLFNGIYYGTAQPAKVK